MKIQTRLSIYSSVVFGIIFILISIFIYSIYSHNARNLIYGNLKKNCYITAFFHLEEDEMSSREFANIRQQFYEFVTESDYLVYNEYNMTVFGNEKLSIPISTLNQIRDKRELSFTTEDFYCYGLFYEDNQGDFVIVTKERRSALRSQTDLLLWILVTAFIIGLLLILGLSQWIAHIAYRPFTQVIEEVKNISANNLEVQIKSPDTKDELQALIDTFNDLLSRISESFLIQKNFVNYVSHEFKTPLASLLGNLEVFMIKDRSPEEYQTLASDLIIQINELQEILDTLLVVSDLRKETDIDSSVRIDELIWDIIDKISIRYPHSKILVHTEIKPSSEQLLSIHKNGTQLMMALFNLIENAVKYSKGNTVDIYLSVCEDNLCFTIMDKGIGIPANQLKNISKPFYRADNTNSLQGSGIGLSIALRILEKNEIAYTIDSEINTGTKVTLLFR